MIVAVDVDEVVADLLEEWVRRYNKDYGHLRHLSRSEIHGWDIAKYAHPSCGDKIYSYLLSDDMYHNIKPIENSFAGVNKIRAAGHRVIFVTSSNFISMRSKMIWLENHRYINTVNGTCRDYAPLMDKWLIKSDAMIDDNHNNFDKYDGYRVLFTQPHNTIALPNRDYDYRMFNWEEIDAVIRNMERAYTTKQYNLHR